MAKGISLISGVIFLAITITAVGIVFQAGMPVIQELQASASIERMKDTFTDLDRIIREVASEGRGSKRTVFFKVDPGKLTIDEGSDVIYWELETDADIISPRTSQRFGNLIIGANLDTNASEGTFEGHNVYILENEHLKIFIKNIGSPSNISSYNTSEILLAMYQKDMNEWMRNPSLLKISIDDDSASTIGSGYTDLLQSGPYLPYATVSAFMNSTYMDYFINFTLESGTDFLEIETNLA